jgi:site-specific recombinase XerC
MKFNNSISVVTFIGVLLTFLLDTPMNRDVQELAGHASLSTTQRYIQGDTAAKQRVVDL